MPRPTAPQPPLPSWDEFDYLIQNDFETLARRRVQLKRDQEAITREIDELNAEIGGMLAVANVNSVIFGGHRLTLGYSTKGGRLSKERLLELGVTAEQLALATSPKEPGAAYVRVIALDEEEPD